MDIEHHFIEKGQGQPLVLLHGNGENCDYFKGQIDAFATSFHVYALDTRGHGQTPRGSAPFTIRQFADDLLAFLDARGIDKADLLGFSDGGNIAMVFAMKYPERVIRGSCPPMVTRLPLSEPTLIERNLKIRKSLLFRPTLTCL